MNIERAAKVNSKRDLREVSAYLPSGYMACAAPDGTIYIVGEDIAGWTLDDYVIPRLRSGLIAAQEIELSELPPLASL